MTFDWSEMTCVAHWSHHKSLGYTSENKTWQTHRRYFRSHGIVVAFMLIPAVSDEQVLLLVIWSEDLLVPICSPGICHKHIWSVSLSKPWFCILSLQTWKMLVQQWNPPATQNASARTRTSRTWPDVMQLQALACALADTPCPRAFVLVGLITHPPFILTMSFVVVRFLFIRAPCVPFLCLCFYPANQSRINSFPFWRQCIITTLRVCQKIIIIIISCNERIKLQNNILSKVIWKKLCGAVAQKIQIYTAQNTQSWRGTKFRKHWSKKRNRFWRCASNGIWLLC